MISPFSDFKAQEIAPEKMNAFFVRPNYLDKLISTNASLIIGQRGSGKTTAMKHLTQKFNSEAGKYIGLYFHFETSFMKSLYIENNSFEDNITLFLQIIVCILGKQLCQVLRDFKHTKSFEYEKEICSSISKFILINECEITDYSSLSDLFEKARLETWFSFRNKSKKNCFCEYTSILSEFCKLLHKEDFFKDGCVCIFFDEYENLNSHQQRAINSLIKSASYDLTYKVAMRPEGMKTRLTLSDNEQLKSGDDYENIDYISDILGSPDQVISFIKDTCKKRLKYNYEQRNVLFSDDDLDIENCLMSLSDEEEIKNLNGIDIYVRNISERIVAVSNGLISYEDVESLGKDIIKKRLLLLIIEKSKSKNYQELFFEFKTEGRQYSNWKHNYKKNVLYSVIDECGNKKVYCGFKTIVMLSNYVVRLILEILHYTFESYLCLDDQNNPVRNIPVNIQNLAIRKVSEMECNEIYFIPNNGQEIMQMTIILGRLYKKFLTDRKARKFEVNHFTIKSTSLAKSDRDKIDFALQNACIWGVLIAERVTKKKQWADLKYNEKEYILHPIYAPYFNISYRKKQSCTLEDTDLLKMLKIGKQGLPRIHQKIFDDISSNDQNIQLRF